MKILTAWWNTSGRCARKSNRVGKRGSHCEPPHVGLRKSASLRLALHPLGIAQEGTMHLMCFSIAICLIPAFAEQAQDSEAARNAAILDNLGSHYQHEGNYTRADQYYRRSIEAWQAARGANDPAVARPLNNLGSL
ncbi:MAG: tetratricopeptide repeat protein, partial [Acidobacteria bacterium]|nr:tetratricopeptide repeat protein [Acidobacteriota bacterium]